MAQSQTVVPLILDYRECSKIKASFCDPLACNFRKLVFGKADASRVEFPMSFGSLLKSCDSALQAWREHHLWRLDSGVHPTAGFPDSNLVPSRKTRMHPRRASAPGASSSFAGHKFGSKLTLAALRYCTERCGQHRRRRLCANGRLRRRSPPRRQVHPHCRSKLRARPCNL
jgi:hypothetical protein